MRRPSTVRGEWCSRAGHVCSPLRRLRCRSSAGDGAQRSFCHLPPPHPPGGMLGPCWVLTWTSSCSFIWEDSWQALPLALPELAVSPWFWGSGFWGTFWLLHTLLLLLSQQLMLSSSVVAEEEWGIRMVRGEVSAPRVSLG